MLGNHSIKWDAAEGHLLLTFGGWYMDQTLAVIFAVNHLVREVLKHWTIGHVHKLNVKDAESEDNSILRGKWSSQGSDLTSWEQLQQIHETAMESFVQMSSIHSSGWIYKIELIHFFYKRAKTTCAQFCMTVWVNEWMWLVVLSAFIGR